MNLKKFSLIAFTALTVFTTISCDNSDDSGDIIDPNEVIAPTAYSFERGTESTVSFSGQTTRINMGNEIGDALKDPTLTLASINAMYNHQVGENDFSDADLNASDKNLISKTAASRDYFFTNSVDAAAIKADFTSFITGQVNEVFPAWNNLASSGVAGQLQEAGGGSTRYINSKGLEYNQAFIKGTIGAVMLDQINNHYLGESILDEASNRDDNDADILATDKNYTNMEHKWDEAFGYLYGAEADIENPVLDVDEFLNKYLSRVEDDADFAGIAQEVYDAFKLGRAAIVAKNYTVRDEQANILREKLSMVIGIRSVFYLQQGKNSLVNDKASAFHDLSEGYGFIYSLQFTRNPNTDLPYFSKTEVDNYLAQLMNGNGFWDVTEATLDQISNEISARFTFTTAQAGS